jgi:Sulfotransferase domain
MARNPLSTTKERANVTRLANRFLTVRVPEPFNQPVKSFVEGYGLATSAMRSLPDFIIIGGQRCATSSLHLYLAEHRAIGAPSMKEVHFFDLNFDRGFLWYRGHFPTAAYMHVLSRIAGMRSTTGEGSPYYMFHPTAPYRIADTLPDVKLIVMLRDPVARLISHYHHERSLGFEHLPLSEALKLENERLEGEEERIISDPTYNSYSHQHHSYVARGRYAEQLERWFDVFPREQILILESKRFFSDPTSGYDRTLGFLGMPPAGRTSFEAVNTLRYPPVEVDLRAELYDYYRTHNARLYAMLGQDYDWERSAP